MSVYIDLAIKNFPRILTCMDRNSFSKTYGCLHRDFWMYKTSDFPDAVRQFGLHAIALLYKNKFNEKNIYFQNRQVLSYIKAGLIFWTQIQNKDGSFDEFYPNERGWVGPTAFTTYTSCETYKLIRDELNENEKELICNSIRRSAYFISKGDKEKDYLANHHAMACLAVWKSYKILEDKKLYDGYRNLFNNFKKMHNFNEGWSLEYDGIDPGYLSATVSFLAKIYSDNEDLEILEICKKSIETCSYFFYPNGFYGGAIGSRNTQHIYSHGFEIFSNKIELARRISSEILESYKHDKLVPPQNMSDRYLFYRIPELILSEIENLKNKKNINPEQEKMPWEKENFIKNFKDCGVYIVNSDKNYFLCNLSKGGVFEIYNKEKRELIQFDCGIIVKKNNNQILSSQWIDKNYMINIENKNITIEGNLKNIPGNKTFSIYTNILFRLTLIFLNLFPFLSHKLKGLIRMIIVLGKKETKIKFKRTINLEKNHIKIVDNLHNLNNLKIKSIILGGVFYNRFVPQSQFFQNYEIIDNNNKKVFTPSDIDRKRYNGLIIYERNLNLE